MRIEVNWEQDGYGTVWRSEKAISDGAWGSTARVTLIGEVREVAPGAWSACWIEGGNRKTADDVYPDYETAVSAIAAVDTVERETWTPKP